MSGKGASLYVNPRYQRRLSTLQSSTAGDLMLRDQETSIYLSLRMEYVIPTADAGLDPAADSCAR